MSRTPNYHMNPYSGGVPGRNQGFSPYGQNRSPMGPPEGPRHGGYFSPQHGQGSEPPMGSGPGMMQQGQRFTPRSSSPFYQSPSPYQQQSPRHSSPHHSGGRGGQEGNGGGYQRRDSRGRGGRGGWGGQGGDHFTPSGHQQFHNRRRFSGSPFQRGGHGGNSSDIEQYFKPSMLEDPWRKLVANKPSSSS